jgi:hypothetical protein
MATSKETEAGQQSSASQHAAHEAAETTHEVPQERTNFAALILGNPNYFGNLTDSSFEPVASIQGNTTYEELKCVGYNPDVDLLKAVIWVKLPIGFLGGLCSAGSQEYVRFYISADSPSSSGSDRPARDSSFPPRSRSRCSRRARSTAATRKWHAERRGEAQCVMGRHLELGRHGRSRVREARGPRRERSARARPMR